MASTPLLSSPYPFPSALAEATARTLITALINRYAVLARETLDLPEIILLFHPSARIHSPGGRELAPSQLANIMGPAPPKLLRHNITTVDIQFLSDEEARCMSYVVAATDRKCPDHWGVWEDEVKCVEGRWVFTRKEVRVEGVGEGGWLAWVLAGMGVGVEK